MSIRVKLIAAILVPLSVVYLGVLLIGYHVGKRQAVAKAQQHLTELAANHAARLDAQFGAIEQAALATAILLAERTSSLQPRRVDALLARALQRNPALHAACAAFEPSEPGGTDRLARYVARPPRLARLRRRGPRERRQPEDGDRLPAPARSRRDAPGRPGPPEPRRGQPSGPGRAAPGGASLRRGDLAAIDPNFHQADWYQAAGTEQLAGWSEPRREPAAGGDAVCRYVVPIVPDEEFKGVVAFDLAVAPLQRYVARTQLEEGFCMLISRDSLLVAHPRPELQMRESLLGLARSRRQLKWAALARETAAGKSGVLKVKDFRTGVWHWVVHAPVSSPGWSFAAVIPEEQIMAPVYEQLRRNVAIMIGGLGLLIGVVLAVSIGITRPISRLASAVRQVAKGDLHARVEDVTSRDEIGEFAGAFNGMVADLNEHVEALTRETAARKAVESELRIAREIQASLLPHTFPPFADRGEFDLHATNVPAKEVAGDFFDFFFLDDDVLAFLIADVSGKGVPAALFMAVTRTVLRNQALNHTPPGEVLNRANRIIAAENDRTMFVTVFFAHYHTRTGKLLYANAGHNPPCMGKAGGDVLRLDGSTGPLLGVFEERPFCQYGQREIQMDPSDLLILYTDGVTEATDADGRQFQLDGLERLVAENPGASPEAICRLVIRAVEEHRDHPRQDDVTVLALRRNR